MTTTSIIDRVRRLVQDTENPYHWTDETLKKDIQASILTLHSVRPETRYVNGSLVDKITLPASAAESIGIDDRFEECIAYFAAHLAYSDDCTDPVSKALSDDFLAKFNALSKL